MSYELYISRFLYNCWAHTTVFGIRLNCLILYALILHYHLQPIEMPGLLVFAISFHYPTNKQFSFCKLIAVYLFMTFFAFCRTEGQTFSLYKWAQPNQSWWIHCCKWFQISFYLVRIRPRDVSFFSIKINCDPLINQNILPFSFSYFS